MCYKSFFMIIVTLYFFVTLSLTQQADKKARYFPSLSLQIVSLSGRYNIETGINYSIYI